MGKAGKKKKKTTEYLNEDKKCKVQKEELNEVLKGSLT